MPNPENLTEYTEGFVIDDDEIPNGSNAADEFRRKIVFNGLAHLYKGVDWLNVNTKPEDEDEDFGGTVIFVSFCAEGVRELKPFSELSLDERLTRVQIQRHLTRYIGD